MACLVGRRVVASIRRNRASGDMVDGSLLAPWRCMANGAVVEGKW